MDEKVKVILIGVLGGLGVLARYLIDRNIGERFGGNFPVGIFIINFFGCVLVGFLFVLASERHIISPEVRDIGAVGFAGGFTTFSAYCFQAYQLFQGGSVGVGLLYFVMSPVVGILGVALSIKMAALLL